MNSVIDTSPEDDMLGNGLKRIVFMDQFGSVAGKDFSSSPTDQVAYSFGILPPSERYKIAPPRPINVSCLVDYSRAYKSLRQHELTVRIDEAMFVRFVEALTRIDERLQKNIQRKTQCLERYQTVYELVSCTDPLL